MEISRESIRVTEPGLRHSVSVMVEGDVVLPDTKPDIEEVLLADARAVVTEASCRGGRLQVSGNVYFHVLYTSDGENNETEAVEVCLPFVERAELGCEDGLAFCTTAKAEHISFAAVNSRKLSAKVLVSILAYAEESRTLSPIGNVSGKGIEVQTKTYTMDRSAADVQTEINVSDLLTIPESMPDIDVLLKTEANCFATECKVMNGKVMVKGILQLKNLYTAANNEAKMEAVCHDVPFTELLEAPGCEEDSAVCVTFDVKTIQAGARGDINGDTKIISISIDLIANLMTVTKQEITLAEDCYATCGTLEITAENLPISEVLASYRSEFVEEQTISVPKGAVLGEILSASCKPILRDTAYKNGALVCTGTLVLFLLYRDGESGIVRNCVTETEFSHTIATTCEDAAADCRIWVKKADVQAAGADSAKAEITLGLFAKLIKPTRITVLTECDVKDTETPKETLPDMVIYFAEEGETLWEIAKKYKTSKEKIKTTNQLETDIICEKRKLLIPKIGA